MTFYIITGMEKQLHAQNFKITTMYEVYSCTHTYCSKTEILKLTFSRFNHGATKIQVQILRAGLCAIDFTQLGQKVFWY